MFQIPTVLPDPNKSLTNPNLYWSYHINLDLFTGRTKIASSSQSQSRLKLFQVEEKAFLDKVCDIDISVLKPPLYPSQPLGTVS